MPVPPKLGASPVRVLVVDDEPAVTQMIALAIHTAHPEYEVTEAHDGFRAGTLVANLSPDVVILDLRMPGMDGHEVCRLIKSQEKTRHITVLAMTAHPTPENQSEILNCGARVCLNKPLDIEKLLGEIELARKTTEE